MKPFLEKPPCIGQRVICAERPGKHGVSAFYCSCFETRGIYAEILGVIVLFNQRMNNVMIGFHPVDLRIIFFLPFRTLNDYKNLVRMILNGKIITWAFAYVYILWSIFRSKKSINCFQNNKVLLRELSHCSITYTNLISVIHHFVGNIN